MAGILKFLTLKLGSAELTVNNATTGKILPAALSADEYTPTLTNVGNISASDTPSGFYFQAGSYVIVYFQADATASGAGECTLGVSIPVASNFAASTDAKGDASGDNQSSTENVTGRVIADTTNDRLSIVFTATAAQEYRLRGSAMYKII